MWNREMLRKEIKTVLKSLNNLKCVWTFLKELNITRPTEIYKSLKFQQIISLSEKHTYQD